jgi:hypothetical protein
VGSPTPVPESYHPSASQSFSRHPLRCSSPSAGAPVASLTSVVLGASRLEARQDSAGGPRS